MKLSLAKQCQELKNKINNDSNRINENIKNYGIILSKLKTLKDDVKSKLVNEHSEVFKNGSFLNIQFDKKLQKNKLCISEFVEKKLICNSEDDFNVLKNNPVKSSDQFNDWSVHTYYFFEQNIKNGQGHKLTNNLLSGIEHELLRYSWKYDNKIIASKGSPVYSVYINNHKLNTYNLTVKVTGTDSDNDLVSIVLAQYKDKNGKEHTLDLVRSRSNISNAIYLDVNSI